MTSSLFVNIRAARNGVKYRPAGCIFCVDGTVYPGAPAPPFPARDGGQGLFCGFSSGIAGGLMNVADGLWASSMIGYPAVTFPMWPSVQIGRTNLIYAMKMYADWYLSVNGSYAGMALVLSGYSQGAMVTNQVWVLDILAADGVLHYLLPYVYRMYNFGDIFRSPGIAHGNTLAGLTQDIKADGVETGGIGGVLDLTPEQTNYAAPDGQPVVQSSTNYGDLYGCSPCGLTPWTKLAPAGKVGNMFFKILMQPTFFDIVGAAALIGVPVGAIEEMINTLKFFAEGMSSPHYEYFPQMDAVIGAMVALGESLPHQLGH